MKNKKETKPKKTNVFFNSLKEDFINFIKQHWLRFIGYLCMFVVPLVVLLSVYVQKVENATKYTVPFAIILPIAMLLFAFFGKIKSAFNEKLGSMKTQNAIEEGKHAALIIIFETVKVLMTILPFALCYIFVNELQKYFAQVSKIFLFVTICEAVGGLFIILDTIKNATKTESSEEKKSDE